MKGRVAHPRGRAGAWRSGSSHRPPGKTRDLLSVGMNVGSWKIIAKTHWSIVGPFDRVPVEILRGAQDEEVVVGNVGLLLLVAQDLDACRRRAKHALPSQRGADREGRRRGSCTGSWCA